MGPQPLEGRFRWKLHAPVCNRGGTLDVHPPPGRANHLICTRPLDMHDRSTTPAAQHPLCQRTPALAHACHEYLR